MASTYSPLLRLELMATGEKNGLWGNITNTNLSTILEQAIAGTVTISITGTTGSITLTSIDGAADQARAAMLLITGNRATPVDIIAPASSKMYFVNNSSGQQVTIKTSTSTGVAIPTGIKRFVYYDTSASDFALGPSANVNGTVTSVDINPNSTGLTFSGGPITTSGSFSVGGTLALANGGTGATTQANAINNLLPSQSAQGGKYLYTDGSNVSWEPVSNTFGTVTSVGLGTTLSGITITGSPVTVSGVLSLGGVLGITSGGTGQTTANAGFNALAPSQATNSGKFLTTDGTDTSWSSAVTSINASGGTTGLSFSGGPITTTGTLTLGGALGVSNGGTGATSASNAINNLLPSQSGQAGKYITTDGSNISWASIATATGTVTSVAFSGGTTGFSVTGSPITTSGTITLAGTLNISNGGTGATTVSGARTNLGLGSLATANSVDLTSQVSGTLPVANGGTAATSAAAAATNLGLGTGSNVQHNSLGIGTAASGTAGEIRATNNITAYYSDERLKTKLGNIKNALNKVCSLNGFYHEANEVAQALGYEKIREVGLSAQEVQKVLPEVVAPAPIDEQYLTVRYERIVPLLVEAIKELQEEIKLLKGIK